MALTDSRSGFGLVAIVFHWVGAILAVGLFISGLWMTGLSYYDEWYNRAPDLHRAFGVVLFVLLGLRLIWRLLNPTPLPEPGTHRWESRLSMVVHWAMYLLLFAIIAAGYLLSTVDGRSIDVFGLFQVPSVYEAGDGFEELAGAVHYWLSMVLAGLVGLHTLGALKHHFIDRNRTLVRMLRPVCRRETNQ